MDGLDRTSYIPLYRQLVNDLIRRMESGELQPGQRIPSERELAERLKVSRITARQALSHLEQLGRVYREQGRGTFVAAPRLARVKGFGSYTEYVMGLGLTPTSRVVKQELEDPDEELRDLLKLQSNEQVLHLVRVRLANDVPLALQSTYLPHSLCPGLENEDLSSSSLFDILRKKYSVYPTWTEPKVSASAASEMEAAVLGLEPGAPVLVVDALTYTDAFQIVERVRTVYRGAGFWLHLDRQRVSG